MSLNASANLSSGVYRPQWSILSSVMGAPTQSSTTPPFRGVEWVDDRLADDKSGIGERHQHTCNLHEPTLWDEPVTRTDINPSFIRRHRMRSDAMPFPARHKYHASAAGPQEPAIISAQEKNRYFSEIDTG